MMMKANKLITEKSPYLLQHAHNPVNWYPWGPEAFNVAKERNIPIFLSIGYFSCHWCHVLEHESFQSPEVAEVMNEHFVSIKVDREERPEIDKIYMTFVQITTGHGGWPLSVWLTPDLKPFYGGTYYPPRDSYGRPGFKTILLAIAERWKNNRDKLIDTGNELAEVLKTVSSQTSGSQTISEDIVHSCFHQLRLSYDKINGGFSTSPKFPTPPTLYFLMRYHALQKTSPLKDSSISITELKAKASAEGLSIKEEPSSLEALVEQYNKFMAKKGRPAEEALGMCLQTLRKMARGGIHDHIAQGFHRYSTDKVWHVPHFEKMLYDQSQLASCYLRAHQITKEPLFASVAEDIFSYVSRDLRDPLGGFYCAEDADSKETATSTHSLEGAFYVWTHKELEDILDRDSELFAYHFGVGAQGNVARESDIQGELAGKNCLFEKYDVSETAKKFAKTEEEVKELLDACRKKLFQAQKARPRPNLDDKIVTSWNGLMISAFSEGYQILGNAAYLNYALQAAEFFHQHMYDPISHVLQRSFRQGPSPIEGFADDYAFLIQGLLDLYECTFDEKWLRWAVSLQRKQDELFWDADQHGYFSSTGQDPSVIVRMKDEDDGSEPSAGSVSALNLFRLSNLLDDSKMAEKVNELFVSSANRLHRAPHSLTFMASALHIFLRSSFQIIIVGDKGSPDTKALLKVISGHHLPNRILMVIDPKDDKSLLKSNAVAQQCQMLGGKATAYCCRDFQCSLPVTTPEDLEGLLSA